MMLERVLPFARTLLSRAISPGDIAIDATVGNGHDTSFLAKLVGENGHVYGFDIQQQAIDATEKKLKEAGILNRASLFLTGHENVKTCIPENETRMLGGAIFNLGYLPGGNKEIVTNANTTIHAVEQLISMLKVEGVVVLVIYHGHPEGMVERDQLLSFVQQLDQKEVHVLKYEFLNQRNNPPFIIAIEKRPC
jgi:tRNA A58 N-methylase Trm61